MKPNPALAYWLLGVALVGASLVYAIATQQVAPLSSESVELTYDFEFVPKSLHIRVGQMVLWHNTSAVEHTIRCQPGADRQPRSVRVQPFGSGPIAPGGHFARAFTVAGTYHCSAEPRAEPGTHLTIEVLP